MNKEVCMDAVRRSCAETRRLNERKLKSAMFGVRTAEKRWERAHQMERRFNDAVGKANDRAEEVLRSLCAPADDALSKAGIWKGCRVEIQTKDGRTLRGRYDCVRTSWGYFNPENVGMVEVLYKERDDDFDSGVWLDDVASIRKVEENEEEKETTELPEASGGEVQAGG